MKARNEGWESTQRLMTDNMKVSTEMIKRKEEVGVELSKFVFIIKENSIKNLILYYFNHYN